MNTVNERIIEVRKRNGLKQLPFAEALKVSKSLIGNIEAGSQSPSFAFLVTVCEKYNVSANWLIWGIGSYSLDKDNHIPLSARWLRILEVIMSKPEPFQDAVATLLDHHIFDLANVIEQDKRAQ